MIAKGDVWWVDLPPPTGSEAAFRRPALVVQCDSLNASGIGTVLVVPITSSLRFAAAPGNVLVRSAESGLPRDSVANVSQLRALARTRFDERVGRVRPGTLDAVIAGIDVVLGRAR